MGRFTKLLSQSGFIVINRDIAKSKGVEFALVLSVLCRLQEEFEKNDHYKDNDGFFQSMEKLQEESLVCKRTLMKVLNELKELGIISVIKKGNPCRNYYKVSDENIGILLFQLFQNAQQVGASMHQQDGERMHQQDGESMHQLYITNNNTNNKKLIIKEQITVDSNQPTINRQLTKDETRYFDSIKKIIDMVNQCCGKKYTYNNKTYNKCIIARLKEGATFEMFCKVAIVWNLKWKDTEFKQYIKPDTLFNEKFWSRAESEIPDGIISEIKSKYGLDLRPQKTKKEEREEFIC